MSTTKMISDPSLKIRIMADVAASGVYPEYLLWIGCAGSFDERYKKVIRSLIRVMNTAGLDFAVLGPEESCTGDPARRAGNEYLFQILALSNIRVLNKYQVKKIITPCPHCYNTLKNEYPSLGGNYKVIHHTQLLDSLLKQGDIDFSRMKDLKGTKIAYHDSCYLGRSNRIYEAPRSLIDRVGAKRVEMDRNRSNGLCCGAGGAQLFKDAENGNKEINVERTEEALSTGAAIIATGCPFCMTMLSDGIKLKNKESSVRVMDIAELLGEKDISENK